MARKVEELVAEISEAARALKAERVLILCGLLVAELHSRPQAAHDEAVKRLLGMLRAWRQFDAVQILADGLIRLGWHEPLVYRQYAQALIDGGRLIPALELLKNLEARTANENEGEYAEVCGLIGRIYKQIYVYSDGADPGLSRNALELAVESYGRIYAKNPAYFWHGVNVAALLRRAERAGTSIAGAPHSMEIARAVTATIKALPLESVTPWAYATAAEAALVCDQYDAAVRWLKQYVEHPDVDAFALAGTLRQLTEIWGFTPDRTHPQGHGGQIVAALRAALLARRNGGLDLTPKAMLDTAASANPETFERILGSGGLLTYKWIQTGMDRAKAVAMVRRTDGRGHGTGFLIRGRDLHVPWGDEVMLLTNSHVVSDDPTERGALRADEAHVSFELCDTAGGERLDHRVGILWSSPSRFLDASVLRLDPPIDVQPCPITDRLPVIDGDDPQRVYILGHPEGRELSFSMQDNELLDYERPPADPSMADRCLIHYRAPTEPGSSGSPVFERMNWRVIGLHHSGGEDMRRLNGRAGMYAANEGIWIQSIRNRVNAELAGQ